MTNDYTIYMYIVANLIFNDEFTLDADDDDNDNDKRQ